MVIAIEGMDGVGKTTISKYISEKYKIRYVEKPIKYIFGKDTKEISNEMNAILSNFYDCDDPILKTWFFGLGNLLAIKNHENEDIVIDRHFLSNFTWNSNEKCYPIYDLLVNYIGIPDLTIYLYADEAARIERLKCRDESDPDLADINTELNKVKDNLQFMKKYNMPYVFIDTTDMSVEKVENRIDVVLAEKLNKKIYKKSIQE